jgi:hypothetical protein
MRLFFLLLFSVSIGAHAGERYATREGPAAALAAFSRAAHENPLQASGENALRVWTRDYMMGRVQGYIISKNGVLLCRIRSTYADGIVTLGRASCRPSAKGAGALRAFGLLPPFSRSEWDCPLMDGGEVFIEGVRAGAYSAVRIGNPDACDDSESKAVVALLSKLW